MEELLGCLALSPLFRDLDPALLHELAAGARRVELASGRTLFVYGEEGDALYLVATGRLRASLPTPAGEKIIGDAGRGDVVGEMALIVGEPRTATVRAVRDSVLIRIGKADVDHLLDLHPAAMMQFARIIVQRLRNQGIARRRDMLLSTRTLALVQSGVAPDAMIELAQRLAENLAPIGAVRVLDSAAVNEALGAGYADAGFDDPERNSILLNWLSDLEGQYRYLIFAADPGMTAWSARCLRQADRILLVVDAREEPVTSEAARHIETNDIQAPLELLLLHPGNAIATCDPVGWCARNKAVAHHHVQRQSPGDVLRLARMITGRATGVVFGGGGARGFAHLGLIRALAGLGQAVDLTGGTSMGALISALVAQARPLDDIRAVLHELFVAHNYLNDYSLSRVSLIGGRKFRKQLEKIFGMQRIETLPIAYFCVSTNLTRGAAVIHERGLVTDWVATSMTVPGIGPPVVWQGDLLVDGGLLNNVPTDVMQSLGRGTVIGSDVSNVVELRLEGVDSEEPKDLLRFGAAARAFNVARILFRSATLVDEDQVKARRSSADLYLRMPVAGVGTFDWEAAAALEEQAYAYASVELERFCSAQSSAQ